MTTPHQHCTNVKLGKDAEEEFGKGDTGYTMKKYLMIIDTSPLLDYSEEK